MISVRWFGRRSFVEGLEIQEAFYQKIRSNCPSRKHFLCLLEHSPVYTVGLRDHFYDAKEERELRRSGADFQRIKRGGLITFHGPGQLVAYPILNLRDLRVDNQSVGVRRYISLIEEVIIRLARDHFGIHGVSRTANPGVWVDENRKLAAIGVQVRSGITSHGLALNCNTEMKWFEKIIPCGLEGKTATSISIETRKNIRIEETILPFAQTFEQVFELHTTLVDSRIALVDESHESLRSET